MAFWCTPEEKQEIERLAKLHGCSKRSDYMRQVCLGYKQAYRAELEKETETLKQTKRK